MSTAVVSRARFEAMKERGDRAVARARQIGQGAQMAGLRPALGVLAGNALAGQVDARWGEGAASLAGIAIGVTGYFIKQPDLVSVGTGMLGPAVYRASLAKGKEWMAAQGAPAKVAA